MLRDPCGRTIDYLRVSVTDRCNLRCLYCMPGEGVKLRPRSEILSLEEIHAVVSAGLGLGIRRVRLTGGEPLLRANLTALVAMLSREPLLDDLSMTTNALHLSREAATFADAGLKRINISLNTLRPERFEAIARGGSLAEVRNGIDCALAARFDPIKVNVVLLKGLNDDEIPDFLALAKETPLHVRFIELMPLGQARELFDERFFSIDDARRIVERAAGALSPLGAPPGGGPSQAFSMEGFRGTVGFIGNHEGQVCARCNRLRLTADGFIKTCLHSGDEFSTRPALREEYREEALRRVYREAVASRVKDLHVRRDTTTRGMSQIGG